MKKELEKHFEFLSKMSVKEYVFYIRKYNDRIF